MLDIMFLLASDTRAFEAVKVEELNVVPLIVVVAAMLPGAMKVLGIESVTAPVLAEAVISLPVPAMLVTPPAGNACHVGNALLDT